MAFWNILHTCPTIIDCDTIVIKSNSVIVRFLRTPGSQIEGVRVCTILWLESIFQELIDRLAIQGPAQAMNIRDSLAEIKSDIVVKVHSHASLSLAEPCPLLV